MTPRRALAPNALAAFPLSGLLVLAGAGRAAAAAPASDAASPSLSGLDAFIGETMEDWSVPGLAIAVVRDGEVVLARGYGVRRQGGSDPVDADTLFAIGSSSKAFTAACVGMLVDEKKVGWDDPVTKHLPGFQLHDPYATRELTVRDLLTHRSGLARGDQLWYGSGFDRAEILERVRQLEPSWSFRSRFGYQNLMFLAAGELYAAVSGQSWDDCVEERLFAPLGMARSTTSIDPLPAIDNVATPHDEVEGVVVPVAWRDLDNVAPAGSINSSAREMALWVALQLAHGKAGGVQVLAEPTLEEMRTPQTVVRKEGP